MNFDFSALLVFLTFASGIIWAADAWFFAPRRCKAGNTNEPSAGTLDIQDSGEPVWVEYARSFFPVFLIVLVLRSFIMEPFRIPSGSMMPTLLIGDFILVNKFDYGIRLPVLHTKIVDNNTPERGDIVVFRYPENPRIPYIKRVVGLPGDIVSYRDKQLYINREPMLQEFKGPYKSTDAARGINEVLWYEEQLEDVNHDILHNPWRHSMERSVVVPPGHYYVMGDNRDNSTDSRVWGFVPDENLVGRAFFIWMNFKYDKIFNPFSWNADLRRIGTSLK